MVCSRGRWESVLSSGKLSALWPRLLDKLLILFSGPHGSVHTLPNAHPILAHTLPNISTCYLTSAECSL